MRTIPFNQVIAKGCGLDVHKKEIAATISGDQITTETRSFGSTTSSLTELKDNYSRPTNSTISHIKTTQITS
ncbi:MAG: hypothetical protein SNF93_02840 [Rikenellaceae bacterium]